MNEISRPPKRDDGVPDRLSALLDGLGIAVVTYPHPAVFTVAESAPVKASIPGAHTKNLFLKDRKGRMFLVTAKDDTAIDLKGLGVLLGAAGRLSFGSADLLRTVLGVEPGSVTPLAAVSDEAGRVEVVLDEVLSRHATVNVHPLRNDRTTAIRWPDLLAVLRATGHEPRVLALPGPPPGPADCGPGPTCPS